MQREKVFVGLSGGVDSSVAALRLIKAGYDVTGVFIKVWHPDFMVCNWEEERVDAMRVAAKLGIPFLTCDAEEAYREQVAKYFIESYRHGITPNPDVMCNKAVKFGVFLDFAIESGADYIATGHYVQRETINNTVALKRGIDNNKDQSYFLWSLSEAQLAKSLFPVGDTSKEMIRKEADAAGLPTARKKDSQGVCFLGHVDIPEFLSHYIELVPGPVCNEVGEVIGNHQGVFVYTIGQRHGFTIHSKSEERRPHFVVKKDIENNTLITSETPPTLETKSIVELSQCVLRCEIKDQTPLTAQFRYRQKPVAVTFVKYEAEKITVKLNETTERPTVGQSCVLFDDDICLGGGIIAL